MKANEVIEHEGSFYKAVDSYKLCEGCDLFNTSLMAASHCKAPDIDCKGLILKKTGKPIIVTDQDDYEYMTPAEGLLIVGLLLLIVLVAIAVFWGLFWLVTHINWQYVHDALLPYTAWVVLGIFYTWYFISKIKQYKNQKKNGK